MSDFFSAGVRLGLVYSYLFSRRSLANPQQTEQLNKIENYLDGLRDNVLDGTLTNISLILESLISYKAQVDAV